MLTGIAMRRLLPILGWFMVAFTLWTGVPAHAAEAVGCDEISAGQSIVHAEGVGDEVPADSDTPIPHHHNGCHGHQFSTVTGAALSSHGDLSSMEQPILMSDIHDSADADTALRPPIT